LKQKLLLQYHMLGQVGFNPTSSLLASQDETELPKGDYRSSMPSFCACFKSIFQVHTETGNIWTHLLGFVLSLCLGTLTLLPSESSMASLQEKVVFGMLFWEQCCASASPAYSVFSATRSTAPHSQGSSTSASPVSPAYLSPSGIVFAQGPACTWWVIRWTGKQDVCLKGI
uniref:Uncharacterized protein n=1 Tax=Serinus canaria TaxID=9135 RepID=A0A8C9NLN2_SERCA